MTDHAKRTREQLRAETRKRDLPTTGTKQDLIDRLEAADRQNDGDGDGSAGSRGRPRDLAPQAARQLAQLTRREVEGVSGFGRTEEGWRVKLDVVEVAKIPSSADVLASYEVLLDDDGELLSYDRVTRYVRGAVGED